MENKLQQDYKGFTILVIEEKELKSIDNLGLGRSYWIVLTDGKRTIKREFFTPLASAIDTPANEDIFIEMVLNWAKKLIDDNLFSDPHHQMFVYANREFKNVVDNT